MNVEAIKALSKLKVNRGLLVARKYSPEILTAVGIVGGVTAAVMGAKATLKLEPIVDELEVKVELAKEHQIEHETTDAAHKRVLAFLYTRSAIDISKLYGPSISLGLVSIGCVVGAHGIMQKRNVAIVAAYSAIEKSFSEYRKRVEDVVGIEQADAIRFNATEVDVPVEDGSKETKKALQVDPNTTSVYAKFFDEFSKNWDPKPEYNIVFLRCQQQYANDILLARGHLFLNEVYDMLDIPRTQAGQVVGWVLSKDGDNFVDFGFLSDQERVRAFVNGYEPSVKLDFNVDGVIFDKIA